MPHAGSGPRCPYTATRYIRVKRSVSSGGWRKGLAQSGQPYYEAKNSRSVHGSSLDLSRAWWTPPTAPHEAWALERRHIEDRFGRHALVSLTDHNEIEAPRWFE